nr:uncharacterized protein LOC126517764 [Dermacentor andersoni]
MSVVLHCGFKAIENLEAHFRPSTLEKGRQLYDNNHVYRVREVNGTDISAKCLSQQSKQAYDVELQLSIAPRTILKGTCTCRYGALGDCKHCAAVVFYTNLHEDVSCTSGPQSWGKPSRKPDHDDKVPLRKLFGGRMLLLSVLCVSLYYLAFLSYPFVGNKQPAELPPTYVTQHFGGIESPFTTVLKEMEKSEAEIRWHKERKVRISSTAAHTILRTRRGPKEIVHSLLKSNFFSSEATTYGIRMEPVARKDFEQQRGVTVTEVGLLLHPQQPWLCGSPDGIFSLSGETCLLEIKCPYRCIDRGIFDDSGHSILDYVHHVDGNPILRKSHRYYTQVQILMYLLNAKQCFFFVYSKKQSVTMVVGRDDAFLQEAIPTLEQFYFQWILCELVRRQS